MHKVQTKIELKYYIDCPHCGESKSRIDHLFNDGTEDKTFGTWYCDECGGGYKGIVKGRDVFVEKVLDRMDKSIVFLRNGNILLAVKGRRLNGKLDISRDKYYYNESTCPTNYLKDIIQVFDLEHNEPDPHGIFEYVCTIPYVDIDNGQDLKQIILQEIQL
jgi:Zn finger protein HypA/HybF involved in hydrogenase expression